MADPTRTRPTGLWSSRPASTAAARGRDLVGRRHPEYTAFLRTWERALDSLEGGDAYRNATYGTDAAGNPVRNLVRHKRESAPPQSRVDAGGYHVPAAGSDPHAAANHDDYEMRRSRTPPPRLFFTAINKHLSKVYSEEVDRSGPDDYLAWLGNVDGARTAIDAWMRDTVAPLLLALGQVDVAIDHPAPPAGVDVATQADVRALKLDSAIARVVLPTNLPWWRLEPDGSYAECLVREWREDEAGECVATFRHWTPAGSTLLDANGAVLDERPHAFGRVPIVRLFVARRPRHRNVGASPYEGVLDLERELYNVQSEIIAFNVLQAHPLLQLPESLTSREGEVSVGPNWAIPKPFREGKELEASYLKPEPGGVEFLRQTTLDLAEQVERLTCQTKPAGAASTTTGQSGISKALDQEDGNAFLTAIAGKLASAERRIGELAVTVLRDGNAPDWDALPDDAPEAVSVRYPSGFNLYSADDLAKFAQAFQAWLAGTGSAPETEAATARVWIRRGLPGLDDDAYEALDRELADAIAANADRRETLAEAGTRALARTADAVDVEVPEPADATESEPGSGDGPDEGDPQDSED